MSYRQQKYAAPDYLAQLLPLLLPPEKLTVSQWAEKYRMLDAKSSALPGPWRNAMTPYLAGIMDALNDYETEEVVFCKPTQVGGTEALQNAVGYVVSQDPAPTMIVYPTDILAKFTSENRLEPMIQASPALKKRYLERQSGAMELQFEGMYIALCGANSPSSLASRPIRYLFLDEVDKFPGAGKKEADAISLARERTKTFSNRKIMMCSTPTLRTGQIWKALETADVEKHYFVPCPHCGEYIELKWAQVRFPSGEGMSAADRAEQAVYICQSCGCCITDAQKPAMLRAGQWRAVRGREAVPVRVGFWMNTLYSPFVRFSQMVKEWLLSQDDPERMQNFVNSWLAEPWENTKLHTEADTVLARQTQLPEFTVPAWGKLLTGGVDVQENCLYWTIRAWGDHLTSQNVAHGQALGWGDVERAMNAAYPRDGGGEMLVDLCLVDSGHSTDEVYEFCLMNGEWALPCKGASGAMNSNYKISTINKAGSAASGMQLVLIDGGRYKDLIAARMRRENGRGAWMVYAGCDVEYAQQVTAEHLVLNSAGKEVWVPKRSHGDNHYLDCEVYAAAAADLMGVRELFLRTEETGETGPSAEENWIKTHEMGG